MIAQKGANYAVLASGLGVLLVVIVIICCFYSGGLTDKPRNESSEVRKMRDMKNRIEKENASGMYFETIFNV